VAQTCAALHAAIPGAICSVCVTWSPFTVEHRYLQHAALGQAADIIFVMMYDTRSQIFDACIAGANAALPDVKRGAQQWLDVGAPATKVVLGLPWFAFTYPCQHISADGRFCTLIPTAYQGVNSRRH
jgi:di-N-acetylchitobiase